MDHGELITTLIIVGALLGIMSVTVRHRPGVQFGVLFTAAGMYVAALILHLWVVP